MALVPVRSPVRKYASAASTASVPIDTCTAQNPLKSPVGRLFRREGNLERIDTTCAIEGAKTCTARRMKLIQLSG